MTTVVASFVADFKHITAATTIVMGKIAFEIILPNTQSAQFNSSQDDSTACDGVMLCQATLKIVNNRRISAKIAKFLLIILFIFFFP